MLLRSTLAIALLASATTGMAQAGSLDQTFGTDGYVTFYFGSENTFPVNALVYPNGQILAVSAVYDQSDDIALERYSADGILDASFGDAGVLTIDVNDGSADRPREAILLPDGKILIVGRIDGSILLMRLEPDGSFDTSFGTNGWMTLDLAADEQMGGFALRPTGEFVFSSTVDLDVGYGYGKVTQYTPDGTLDAAFGTNGVLTIDVEIGATEATEMLFDIALASNGDAYVLGTAFFLANGNDDLYVYRVTPSGTLDPAFDGVGYRLLPIGTERDLYGTIAVTPNDQVLVAGSTGGAGVVDNPFIAKLNADGSFDPAFGSAGVQIMTPINSQVASDLLIEPNGQIVLSGESSNGSGTDMLIARLNADGSFDSGFGTGGVTTTLIGSPAGFEGGGSLALAADGNYIMTGVTGTSMAGTATQVVLKYLSGNVAGILESHAAPVQIYPNPTTGQLWVSTPRPLHAMALTVVDLDGRSAGTLTLNGDGSVELPASLGSGTYLITSADPTRFPPQRVVLMR